MKHFYLLLSFCLLFFFSVPCINAQITYNANTKSAKYTDYFLYGSNMAYKNGNWKDEDIADLLVGSDKKNWEGVGVNSLRPALYENFVEKYGYDVRVSTFNYYSEIGTKNNVVFIGDRPSDKHREKKQYAPGLVSESYENLYEPIWDNGKNGTPVNENNYYALYVYKVVQRYKTNVKFWEIKNEPDYTPASNCASNGPGANCNWWDKDPDPEALKNLRAPIQSYIRMLRISYEVIKSVDPEALVCVGGIGYASFLDAILRNTDNPDGGKVTAAYPQKGGAWFDCLSFHFYPMYSLRRWVGRDKPGNIDGFEHFRHSDAAAKTTMDHKDKLVNLLGKYGYNGNKYPTKEVIITEINIPNKRVGDFIGSVQVQRDFLTKVAVTAQRNKISGIYPYCPWDAKELHENGAEYDYKGFYKPIPNSPGEGSLRMNESGVAWRTMSRNLSNRRYDEAETAKLNLPAEIDGGAFYSSKDKDYVYVLWAKTSKDLNENAAATYSFPTTKNVKKLLYTEWNEQETVVNVNSIKLTQSPVFIQINAEVTTPVPVTGVSLSHASEFLGVKKTLQLLATVIPANANNKNVTWSSANPDIAQVDNLGKVIAVSAGSTKISVKTSDGNKIATCDITVKPDTIALSYILMSSYKNIQIGDTSKLIVTFFPNNTTNQKIRWSSSDPSIASVTQNGIVTAHKVGKVSIVANPEEGSGEKSKGCIVQVSAGTPVVSVSLNQTSGELAIGGILQLSATISPSNATNKNVTWSSSNPAVASVDQKGKMTALSEGAATITMTTTNGGKTATCSIMVKTSQTGIEKIKESLTFIAPNPSTGNFTVQFQTSWQAPVQIELYSAAGVLVDMLLSSQLMEAGIHRLTFNKSLRSGMYVLVIKSKNINERQKLIIK